MPRKQGKAVPGGNGPVPQHDESTLVADIYRLFGEKFDQQLNRVKIHFDQLGERMEKMRGTNQRLVGLDHEARQPRLATEADVETNTKTRKRMEDVAAHRVFNGDNASARRVHTYGPTSLTSVGVKLNPWLFL